MKTMWKRMAACMCVLMLACSCALADGVTMEGTLISVRSEYVTAPIGGIVERVQVEPGDRVMPGDVLALLRTQTVYARQAGRVVFFGEPGDDTEQVAALYGAVAVVEPENAWTVRASTRKAAEGAENKVIHPGETVYIQSVGDRNNKGEGMVTTVSGSEYSVRVTSGSFEAGENVNLYRGGDMAAGTRIGQGSIVRADLDMYTGSGSIVSFLCRSGDTVKKGDALFETLTGTFDGLQMTGREMKSLYAGTVAALGVKEGDTLQKGYPVAEIWTDDSMRLRAKVSEYDLDQVVPGTRVSVEFEARYNASVQGVVEKVLAVPENDGAEESEYGVIIRLDSAEGLKFGLHGTATLATESAED